MSIHDKVPWGPSYVSRKSQIALLGSQTLKDLHDSIPCISNSLPKEADLSDNDSGCVICIEGLAYSIQADNDYAEYLFLSSTLPASGADGFSHSKLVNHLDTLVKKTSNSVIKAPVALQDARLSSLCVRLNEPYWLIHRGNCEHFVVVDQIRWASKRTSTSLRGFVDQESRLIHDTDPHTGYPLRLQTTPALLDLCRGCSKIPAVLSIVGDVRLGESPCVLCGPCWRAMGESEEEGVIILALPECVYD